MQKVSVIRFGWAQNVATPSTVRVSVTANLLASGDRHCLDPYQNPPVALPSAYVPRMNPASGLCPKCCANEIVLRSIDTNIAPSSRYSGKSTNSPGAAAPRCPAVCSTRRPGVRTTTGSVRRSAANHNVPARHSSAATPTPAAGNTWVASSVTAAGPTMKHSSSATDSKEKAACSRGVPASRALHRTRTMAPSDVMDPPAMAPGAKKTQVGAFSRTAAIRAAVEVVNTASSTSSTGRWPRASASRAINGEENAYASDPDADMAPATPYLPVDAEMSRTVPSPNIDICIFNKTATTEKRQAPGTRKISEYGRSGRASRLSGDRPTARSASSTLVIVA